MSDLEPTEYPKPIEPTELAVIISGKHKHDTAAHHGNTLLYSSDSEGQITAFEDS